MHACIESGKRILFVPSQDSDVQLLACDALPSGGYCQVDVGDVDGLVDALHAMERTVMTKRTLEVGGSDQLASIELNAELTH